jgi:hypothetical protein
MADYVFSRLKNIKSLIFKISGTLIVLKKLKSSGNDAGAGAVWSRIEPHHRVQPEP